LISLGDWVIVGYPAMAANHDVTIQGGGKGVHLMVMYITGSFGYGIQQRIGVDIRFIPSEGPNY
jgi:hypothetical protein